MRIQARTDRKAPPNHYHTTSHSKPMESPLRPLKTIPNPQPQSHFPGVAFSPAPKRRPRNAFKRILSHAIHKLKRYLDEKAAKYGTEQHLAAEPTRMPSRLKVQQKGIRRYAKGPTGSRKTTTRVTRIPHTRPLSGALPQLHQGAGTSLEAKGPFSAFQKRELSRKLTTIRESTAEALDNAASFRDMSTLLYNEVDATSNPAHYGPTTPIPEPAEPSEHFPHLTSKRCNVDWMRADRLALKEYALLRNTEAMRAISRDAAVMLRAERGWIRRYDTFDDSAWREQPNLRALSTLLHVSRWRRHHRTNSAHSVPSLSYSDSSQGSINESFPTPANAVQSLCDDYSIEGRLSPSSKTNGSPFMTPVITVSEWAEDEIVNNGPLTSHSGDFRMTSSRVLVAADQPTPLDYLRPPKPMARLRGKQSWYLKGFTPVLNSTPLPLIETLPVPFQHVDFFMERPLMPRVPDQSFTHA